METQDHREDRRGSGSLRDERKEELLNAYQQELHDIQTKRKEQEEIRRPLPKASDYVLPGTEEDAWEGMSDEDKKKEIHGDLRSGWSKWGNLLIAVIVIGVIILFKFLS
jgi:uncharacterized membrane protein YukC